MPLSEILNCRANSVHRGRMARTLSSSALATSSAVRPAEAVIVLCTLSRKATLRDDMASAASFDVSRAFQPGCAGYRDHEKRSASVMEQFRSFGISALPKSHSRELRVATYPRTMLPGTTNEEPGAHNGNGNFVAPSDAGLDSRTGSQRSKEFCGHAAPPCPLGFQNRNPPISRNAVALPPFGNGGSASPDFSGHCFAGFPNLDDGSKRMQF